MLAIIHQSRVGRFFQDRVLPLILNGSPGAPAPGTPVQGTPFPPGFRPGAATTTTTASQPFAPVAQAGTCPPGTRNVRGAGLTLILGPDCRQADVQTQARIPRAFDPLGFVPPIVGPGQEVASQFPAEPIYAARRECPRGPDGKRMVLAAFPGQPEACWPSAMVPRQFRAHPKRPRPAVTAGDVKAIRRADRTRKRLVRLTKQSGAHASMTRPRSSSRGRLAAIESTTPVKRLTPG